MDLSFLSLKDICGTNHIHHLCSALSRKAGESIEYGHFVAHVFDGEEWCVYDGNKINYVQKKSVLEYEEFQKGIYAVSYIRKIDNIETPSLPKCQWSLTKKEEEEVKVIFISQTDKYVVVIRSSNIRSLDGKCWLSSEVLDWALEFMSTKLKCVESLSYITMELYATKSFNFNYLKENTQTSLSCLYLKKIIGPPLFAT